MGMAATANNRKQALKRSNLRTIEMELYNYRDTKREVTAEMAVDLKELDQTAYYARQAAYIANKSDVMGDETGVDPLFIRAEGWHSDPTPMKTEQVMALRRKLIRQYQETLRRIEAIEWMMQCLSSDSEPGKLKLIEYTYFDKWERFEVMRKLSIGQTTYYRWRQEGIRLVAYRLGWIV